MRLTLKQTKNRIQTRLEIVKVKYKYNKVDKPLTVVISF